MKKRAVAFAFIFAAVFLGAFLSGISQNNTEERTYEIAKIKSAENEKYLLKDYMGKLAVFTSKDIKPEIILNIFTNNLPDIDKYRLKEGIEAESYEELMRLIEDFTG